MRVGLKDPAAPLPPGQSPASRWRVCGSFYQQRQHCDKGTQGDAATLNVRPGGQGVCLPSPSSARREAAPSSNERPVNKGSCPACWKMKHQRQEKTANHAHLEFVWTMPTTPREICLFSHHCLERGDERMAGIRLAQCSRGFRGQGEAE